MTDRVDNLQFHYLRGQQSRGPSSVTGRRFPQSQRDDLRFRLAVENRSCRGRLALLPFQSRLETLRHETLADILHRLHPAPKRLADLVIRPRWSVRIRLQQNPRTTCLLRTPLRFTHHFFTCPTLRVGQPHDILHTSCSWEPPCGRKVPRFSHFKSTPIPSLDGAIVWEKRRQIAILRFCLDDS